MAIRVGMRKRGALFFAAYLAALSGGATMWTAETASAKSEKPSKGKPAKPPKPLNKEQIFARVAPATVLIVIPQQGGMNLGSGVIVDGSGLIVTNRHVIERSQGTVQVFMFNPKERSLEANLQAYVKSHAPLIGRVIKRDKENDLALVRLPALAATYPTVEIGDSEALRIGQDVVAIGNPHGLTWTFTSGSISAIRKDAIQTETPINPGNSGGPLLDMFGRLVGINTYIRKDAQGLGFAIPASTAKQFIEKFGNNQEIDNEPDRSSGLQLSKNPVPLAALSIGQDIGKLRALAGKRTSRQAEAVLSRDLDAVEDVRQRMLKGELTVGQALPAVADKLQLLAQHNQATDDASETKAAFLQQLEKTAEHMKQIVQVAK